MEAGMTLRATAVGNHSGSFMPRGPISADRSVLESPATRSVTRPISYSVRSDSRASTVSAQRTTAVLAS
eukprot:9263713-Pyramimonas_sp.AAC.1